MRASVVEFARIKAKVYVGFLGVCGSSGVGT